MSGIDLKLLIGLKEEEAREHASVAGYTLVPEVTNCQFVSKRIQVRVDSDGKVVDAWLG